MAFLGVAALPSVVESKTTTDSISGCISTKKEEFFHAPVTIYAKGKELRCLAYGDKLHYSQSVQRFKDASGRDMMMASGAMDLSFSNILIDTQGIDIAELLSIGIMDKMEIGRIVFHDKNGKAGEQVDMKMTLNHPVVASIGPIKRDPFGMFVIRNPSFVGKIPVA